MKTAQQLEIEANNLAEMCANTARYLREAHEVNAALLEALAYVMKYRGEVPTHIVDECSIAIAKAKAEQS